MRRIKIFSKILLFLSIPSFFLHLSISTSFVDCFWNEGVMLGLGDFLSPMTLVFLMTFLLALTIYVLSHSYRDYWEVLLVLAIASVGNIFDRVFHGAVCDYIKLKLFIDFPTFNLNDIFISISLLLILLIILYESTCCKKNRK